MNKTQVKRFRNLIKSTEEADPKYFTMTRYAHNGDFWNDSYKQHPCGTPACVLGNYAARRDLQKTFELKAERSGFVDISHDLRSRTTLRHFGLCPDEAGDLFNLTGCGNAKTPKQAVRYLKKFLAKKLKANKNA